MPQETRSFREWLRYLRAQRDLTQEALAQQVGCATQTIRMFESGKRRPSRAMAERLAECLQVPQDEQPAFIQLARVPGDGTRVQVDARARDIAPIGSIPEHAPLRAIPASPQGDRPAILATKLYKPRPRADLTPRPRLRARLDAGLTGALTLIAAPAGWGKTTLLADWLSHGDHYHRAAWITLEAGDSSPIVFLRYLLAALQTVAPEVGVPMADLLRTPQVPPMDILLPRLLNDLVELPASSILILDDYHVIDSPEVHQILMFLLDHLPPQLHVVLATRADPPLALSRLRARGLLNELRAAELRFTPDEATSFLQQVTGLRLTADEVAALEARTEGWIAGLQLAALSLRDQTGAGRTEFIAGFAGSHRFVVDYLIDEVLAQQPAHIQSFLLQTSILERLSGELCDAVVLQDWSDTGETPRMKGSSFSQLLLEELERANLFIIPLDDARRWYRYHHLFAQVLRERLARGTKPETVARLHRNASAWYEEQELIAEAVHHALAARDWPGVARLIETHGRALLVNGQAPTVLGWLSQLPASITQAHPYLLHLEALGLFYANQPDAAELRLQMIEEYLSTGTQDASAQALRGHASLLRATILRFRGDFIHSVSLARQALELMPVNDVPRRVTANLFICSAMRASGDVSPGVEQQLVAMVESARASRDSSTLLNGIVNLAALRRRQGRLRDAAATYAEVVQVAREPGRLRALGNGASYAFGMGELLVEWNDLAAAEQHLSQGRELALASLTAGEAGSVVLGYSALARAQMARGDSQGAAATLGELANLAQRRSFDDHLIRRIAAARAHLALQQGDRARAVSWADTNGLRLDDERIPHREAEHLTLARIRIAQGRSSSSGPGLRDVLALLDRWASSAEAGARIDSVITIQILCALAFKAQGDRAAALTALERALTLAAHERYVRVFVDEGRPMAELLAHLLDNRTWDTAPTGHEVCAYAGRLLTLLRAEGVAIRAERDPQDSLGERLTERELQVLRLLVAGHSTQAMAQELVVAVGTVKRHVNNILSKLGVQSRLQAVARARDLNLV